MILADTSAWVEYDRETESEVDRRLAELIESDGPVAVTEPVIMEVLAGARDDRRGTYLRRLLLRFELLGFETVSDFDSAARVGRSSPEAPTPHVVRHGRRQREGDA